MHGKTLRSKLREKLPAGIREGRNHSTLMISFMSVFLRRGSAVMLWRYHWQQPSCISCGQVREVGTLLAINKLISIEYYCCARCELGISFNVTSCACDFVSPPTPSLCCNTEFVNGNRCSRQGQEGTYYSFATISLWYSSDSTYRIRGSQDT